MIATINYADTVIDARRVLAGGDFFDLSMAQLINLLQDYCSAVENFYSARCFLVWDFSGRRRATVKKSVAELGDKPIKFDNGLFCIGYEGIVPSECAKNNTEARRVLRKIRYGWSHPAAYTPYPFFSQDYGPYYEKFIIQHLNDLEEVRNGFEKIYNMEGKKDLDWPSCRDCIGIITAHPHPEKADKYYGEFKISHALVSLDMDVDPFVSWTSKFLYYVSEKYVNVNAYLGLSVEDFPGYLHSFGNYDDSDDCRYKNDPARNNVTMKDNDLLLHYLLGAEWMNVVSPFTAKYLDSSNISPTEAVCVKRGKMGQLSVCASCNILDYDIPQSKEVKHVLYNALFPGGKFFCTDHTSFMSPRSHWEIIPVFPEEVEVYKGGILVAHKGNKIV